MTLVVARTVDDAIHLVSDTKLSFADVIHARPLEHAALKCIVISPTCCVAFANNSYVAEKALAPLLTSNSLERSEIRNHLFECHRSSGGKADFLVATVTDDKGIDLIRNDALEVDLETGWLGDHRAFESFQAHSRDDRNNPISKMMDALQAVINDPLIASVDGFRIHVRAHRSDGIKYLPYTCASGFLPVENLTEPTSMFQSVGAAGGSYRFTVLCPDTAGIGAVGIYILEGRYGVLYYPRWSWSPILMTAVSYSEFIEAIRVRYGVSLTGFGFA